MILAYFHVSLHAHFVDLEEIVSKVLFPSFAEDIYLITVGVRDGRVFLFDIHKCPNIVYDGQLWRILTSNDITKVMHDCRNASFQLRKQFRVALNNVFDTQVNLHTENLFLYSVYGSKEIQFYSIMI